MLRLSNRAMVIAAAAFSVLSPAEAAGQKRQRDVISAEEINASAFSSGDLHQAIRSLRPHFLEPARGVRTLGNGVIEPLAVYLNGTRQTGVEALRTIPAAAVQEVRYLDPTRSWNEFGPRANGGALLIKLRAQPKPPPPPAPTAPPPEA